MAKQAERDIIDRDPMGKWEGGTRENVGNDIGTSAQLKKSLYKETRVLNEKIRKLERMLNERSLSTAEKYALNRSLAESKKAIETVAKNSAKELEFLKESGRYQQDSLRKLSALRRFYTAQQEKKQGGGYNQTEEAKMLRKAADLLSEISKKDIGTGAGRLGTMKGLSRLDKLAEDFPESLRRIFEEQNETTEELAAIQREAMEEQRAAQQKLQEQQAKLAADQKRTAAEQKRIAEELEANQKKAAEDAKQEERQDRERFLREKADKAWEAQQQLNDRRDKFKDSVKQRGMGILDRMGYGHANIGNVVRGIGHANNLRKNWKDGKTAIQRYAQTRATAKGRDASSLRLGLGNTAVEHEDTSRDDFIAKFLARQEPKASSPKTTVAPVNQPAPKLADPMDNQWTKQSPKNSPLVDQPLPGESRTALAEERGLAKIADVLKTHSAANERFNSRLLAQTHALAKKKRDQAETPDKPFDPSDLIKDGIPTGSLLKTLGSTLTGLLPSLLPGIMLALAPALLLKLGVDQKKKIEENPNAPEMKDNTYAMKLRGEASSVGEAASMNQQKALKILQPGTAKLYLERMNQDKVDNFDGYTRQQVVDMSQGKKPTQNLDAFNKIAKGASTAAKAGPAGGADDNGDVQRMAARSGVAIKSGGVAANSGSGASALSQAVSGEPTGAGGLIRESLGKSMSKSSGVDDKGINPQMQERMTSMSQEYFDKTGKRVNLNSGYRSVEEQAKLYASMPRGMAAKPGSSLHNFGLAVDIPSSTANELDKMGLLSKYGFERPIPNEKWHLQPAGMSVAAARSGIYSADAPSDQGSGVAPAVASASPTVPTVASAAADVPNSSAAASAPPSTTAQSNSGGQTTGSSSLSVAAIPTFDSSDGMFLSLNTGVV